MKLRPIGVDCRFLAEGVVLTYEEYKAHPSYTKFLHFEAPKLFLSWDGRNWHFVNPPKGSGFALIEATDEEKDKLRRAGYRMLNL